VVVGGAVEARRNANGIVAAATELPLPRHGGNANGAEVALTGINGRATRTEFLRS
jgi:hypothetical protein